MRWRSSMLVVLMICGCSRSALEPIPPEPPPPRDDKLKVSGEICARASEDLDFPLRVLFVVDASESMEVTDPPDPETGETRREAAVRETWQRLLEQSDAGVAIGIMRFSAQARSRTPVDADGDSLPESFFTDSEDLLLTATRALAVTDRTTNYIGALDEAYFELRAEMLRADLQTLTRSKYVVIFVSDGIPDETDAAARENAPARIVEGVTALRDLAKLFGVGAFAFHTIYLSTPQGAVVDQPAQALLEDMAEAGGGTYRNAPNGDAVDFLHIDLNRIRRVFSLRAFTAISLQALQSNEQRPKLPIPELDTGRFKDSTPDGVLGCGEPLVDSDADGLADLVELRIGTDPLNPDTDDDGVNDRTEWALRVSGLDPTDPTDTGCFIPDRSDVTACDDLDQDGFCDCPDLDADGRCDYIDTDGDGLTDCAEIFVGTSHITADTDHDGLPDLLELRVGTNPTRADATDDFDWDRTENGVEARSGLDPLCDDGALRSKLAYDYRLEALDPDEDNPNTRCQSFRVDRITLMPTLENPGETYPGNGWNRVLLFVGEGAFDEPDLIAGWRIACVEARYEAEGDLKDPPSGQFVLTDADFQPAETFDPDVHCARPGQ